MEASTDAWAEDLRTRLSEAYDAARADALNERYDLAFPSDYRKSFTPAEALGDISSIEELAGHEAASPRLKIRDDSRVAVLSRLASRAPISSVFRRLENLGLRIADHRAFEIHAAGVAAVRIDDFALIQGERLGLIGPDEWHLLEDAFTAVWEGRAADDCLNELVLRCGLEWREVDLVRALYAYLHQAGQPYTPDYVARTLIRHAEVTRLLVRLFSTRFDPSLPADAEQTERDVGHLIDNALDEVDSLNEDRVLRAAAELVTATVRTSYFRAGGAATPYLVLKFEPSRLAFLRHPRPLAETFVYSRRMEGLHLRASRVARGGVRWSDRPEDYRDEVLALMKAQMVKNAVIVPHGAKGAFVLKRAPDAPDPDAVAAEVRECYATFIRGLLDVTDNMVDGEVVPPQKVVCHDGPDPYLVVAADKGTAAFSDLANAIADEYHFWLGDAFASGGSTGYDHKALGITARGAWESARRHLGEQGIDADSDVIRVVGIGDMSGDVFGNGMLRRNLKLVAALDHRHVFIDPDPDPETAFQERCRLFGLPRSSWVDYDPSLISPGGGVFPRHAKHVPLSPEVRRALGIEKDHVSGDELVQAVLRAPVDLLYNGGIGTYVKASAEHNSDVHDRVNDDVRIDARELRARAIVEGGNLGITQRARIEYALAGGRINTDFVDNSAGVDISDREVNIKILLDTAVATGRLDRDRRNQLLADISEDVTSLVLRDSSLQVQAISVTHSLGSAALDREEQFLRYAEAEGLLDRELECLPDDETLAKRRKDDVGLTRPELAVLLAHSKNNLRERLSALPLLDDDYLSGEADGYLPDALRSEFGDLLHRHPLHRSLVAAALTNELHNRAGAGMLLRLHQLSGQTGSLVRAWVTTRDLLDLRSVWHEIDSLDLTRQGGGQSRLLIETRRAAERTTLWLLRNRRAIDPANEVERFGPAMRELRDSLVTVLPDRLRGDLRHLIDSLVRDGAPAPLAEQVLVLDMLAAGIDIAELAHEFRQELTWTAATYYAVVEELDLYWLATTMAERAGDTHWTQLAKGSLVSDLGALVRSLTAAVISAAESKSSPASAVHDWLDRNTHRVQPYRETTAALHEAGRTDVSMLAVALQQLRNLTHSPGSNNPALTIVEEARGTSPPSPVPRVKTSGA